MNIEEMRKTKAELKRFNDVINTFFLAYNTQKNKGCEYPNCPKESGAVRRASMDLTRQLSQMRYSK